jgi:hypothetical protein
MPAKSPLSFSGLVEFAGLSDLVKPDGKLTEKWANSDIQDEAAMRFCCCQTCLPEQRYTHYK